MDSENVWNGNDAVFRTYVAGHGKRPVEKVRGRDSISSFDEVSGCASFGAVLNDDFIDISFDSREMYAAFLRMAAENGWRCLCLPSPHGGHSYWRKPQHYMKSGADRKTAVGFTVDVHKGSTYIPLKVDGKRRFPPDYDTEPGTPYQCVPEELYVFDGATSLWGMGDGEGRNGRLFSYILELQSHLHFGVDTIRGILRNANMFVFSEPLPEAELETVLRDDAFEKPSFYAGKEFLFVEFANYLKDRLHVCCVNEMIYYYDGNVYRSGTKGLYRKMLEHAPRTTDRHRNEVKKYLELICEDRRPAEPRYIAFSNGILDTDTGEMSGFSPDYVIPNVIPWDYDPDAYDENVSKMFGRLSCGDQQIRDLLGECIGFCFYRGSEAIRKAVILTGGKRNGKSTFLDILKCALGDENVSSLDLSSLNDRFSTIHQVNRLANIGDDIGDEFLRGDAVAKFKKIVAGNRIAVEDKGEKVHDAEIYAKQIFSANTIPKMRDKTGAVLDRLEIIPFNAVFTAGTPGFDPDLKRKITGSENAMRYVVKLGVDGLYRILDNGFSFSHSDAVADSLHQYEVENNSLMAFVEENGRETIRNETVTDVYTRYTVFCAESGLSPFGKIAFGKQLCAVLGLSSRVVRGTNGKTRRIYSDP